MQPLSLNSSIIDISNACSLNDILLTPLHLFFVKMLYNIQDTAKLNNAIATPPASFRALARFCGSFRNTYLLLLKVGSPHVLQSFCSTSFSNLTLLFFIYMFLRKHKWGLSIKSAICVKICNAF